MSRWSRRTVLRQGSLALAGLISARARQAAAVARGPAAALTLDASRLASFVDPLPLPVAQRPQGRRSSPLHDAVEAPFYSMDVREIHSSFHRDLPPARMWSYGKTSAPVLFDVRSGEGVLIEWINRLPARQFLPLPPARMGMESAPPTRIVTHVHGARVPSISDGYPDAWFAPGDRKL